MLKIQTSPKGENYYENCSHLRQWRNLPAFRPYRTGVIDANGTGHGALAGLLADNNVDMLICGGIGGGAQIALMEANVRLFAGISGYADDAIEAYLAGKLAHNPNANCSHHDHEHGESDHACGSHGCGSHGCGSHDCH